MTTTGVIVLLTIGVFAIAAVALIATLQGGATDETHNAMLDRLSDEHRADLMAREDLHDRHLAELREVYDARVGDVLGHSEALLSAQLRYADDIRAEREQIARLIVSRTPGDYALLERTSRIPDEALGEAEVHRADVMGLRRRDAPPPSPELVDQGGEAIVPHGAG